jgi:hypothetical protein
MCVSLVIVPLESKPVDVEEVRAPLIPDDLHSRNIHADLPTLDRL